MQNHTLDKKEGVIGKYLYVYKTFLLFNVIFYKLKGNRLFPTCFNLHCCCWLQGNVFGVYEVFNGGHIL